MTEELYEDGEFEDELPDEFDSDEPEDDPRVVAVSQEIARWEREAGVELTDKEFNLLGIQLDLYGIPPEQSYFTHTEEGKQEADFVELVSNIEADQGRQLTQSELHRLAELDTRAELRGEDDINAGEALYDLDSSEGREHYIAERLSVPQERAEASGVLDDSEETPSFNYDNRDEREAAIDAALSGETVSVHDSSDIEGDE